MDTKTRKKTVEDTKTDINKLADSMMNDIANLGLRDLKELILLYLTHAHKTGRFAQWVDIMDADAEDFDTWEEYKNDRDSRS